jgi:PAS domain S-box-containing protein
MLEASLEDLGAAAEELQVQNDALFAARVEMEAQGQFYRELFDLAPAVCLVSTPGAEITHANHAASCFFGRPVNALVGRFIVTLVDHPDRSAFRASLARALATADAVEWPSRLLCRGTAIECRVRVAARWDGDQLRALQWIITEAGGGDDLL